MGTVSHKSLFLGAAKLKDKFVLMPCANIVAPDKTVQAYQELQFCILHKGIFHMTGSCGFSLPFEFSVITDLTLYSIEL